MNFIKQHRRGIALAAAFAFFWLIQVGNFSLQAETATSQQTSVSAQPEQPGTIEQVATSGRHVAKKSPILPIIIGVVVVGAVAAVLILVVFKTKYDIRGTWQVTWQWTAGPDSGYGEAGPFTFAGERTSGTLTDLYGDPGTYIVDGKKTTWILSGYTGFTWSGEFTDKDAMNGTMVWTEEGDSGTWTAVRTSASPAAVVTPRSWKK